VSKKIEKIKMLIATGITRGVRIYFLFKKGPTKKAPSVSVIQNNGSACK